MNKWYLRKIVAGLIVGFGLTGVCQCVEFEPVKIPRCGQAPKMDGSLTEDCWKTAAVLTNFTVIGKGVMTDATECRLTMDDTWIYFGFQCKNPGMQQMDQKEKERDGSVAQDDSVEVFFDPGSDGALFFQFILSYANVQADRMHTQKDGKNAFWDLPWRSATKMEKDGWTAEMAIPLFLIASYGEAAKVRLNVARNERRIILDNMGAKLNEEKESSCWSPVLKSYAEPDKFRSLTGFDGIKIGIPELIALEGAEFGGYETIGDKRGYTVKARLRSYTGKGGKAMIEVRDCPLPDGKGEVVAEEVAVKPMQSEEFIIHVPATSLKERDTMVTLKEPGSGAVLREITIKAAAALNLTSGVVLDRNYYTTEKEARVRIRIGLPEAELKDKTFIVKLADGKVLVKSKIALQDIETAIPLKDVPLGENSLTVALEDANGAVMVEGKTVLTKRAPKPGCEVKVDQFNRRLLKNGTPLFPFGLFKRDCSEEGLKRVAKAEHTGILQWDGWGGRQTIAVMTNMMVKAQALGLDVLDNSCMGHVHHYVDTESAAAGGYGSAFDAIPRDAARAKALMESLAKGLEKARQPVADDIRAIRDFPNLIGYYNVDEPNLLNSETRMIGARALYKWFHQDDGYRPVYTLFARSIPEGGLDVGDVIMYDVYNYPGWANQFYGRPSYMSDQMLRLKQLADGGHKVAMMAPMTEGLDVGRCWRLMLPGEQRSQTYLAVIHGSKGLLYFEDSVLLTQRMWDTLADLARQMKVIGPAAVSGEVYPAVKYAPVELDIKRETYPDVQATLFKNPAGGYILMAANAAYHPVDVKFTVPGLNAKAGVKPLFTDKKITAEGEGFQDTFEPLGTRAYALELRPDAAKPVALALELTAHPEQAMALKFFNPTEEFKRRRNCVANPSFEVVTVPGLPDHVRPCMSPSWPLIGAPGAVGLTLDPINPVHGKVSLRETIPLPAAMGQRGINGMCYILNTDKPVPVVFSAYIKASTNVKEVYISVNGMNSEEAYKYPDGKSACYFKFVTPTTEWRRVTFKGMLDPSRMEYKSVSGDRLAVGYGIGPGNMGTLAVEGKTGQVDFWVDAVQLEIGNQATEFSTQ